MLSNLPPPHVNHDSYWKLSPEERQKRQQDLLGIPFDWQSQSGTTFLYEGKQAPLYYGLMSPVYSWISKTTIPDRVFVFRLINVLLGSLVIPIAFVTAQKTLRHSGAAAGVCALIAAMPCCKRPTKRATTA